MSTVVHFAITIVDGTQDTVGILRETLAQTAAFDGNEGVRVLVDDADDRRLVIEMTWTDSSRYDAYLAWRQTPEGVNRLMGILAEPPSTRRFSSIVPLASDISRS